MIIDGRYIKSVKHLFSKQLSELRECLKHHHAKHKCHIIITAIHADINAMSLKNYPITCYILMTESRKPSIISRLKRL